MMYVIHYCHNKKCNNAWIDEDLTKAKCLPPTWKYCPECVSKGYKNPSRPPLTEAQKKKLKKMRQQKNQRNKPDK